MTPEEPRDYCPRCGVAYAPLQEYCLECGERLPTNRGVVGVLASRWQRHFAWYPGDWIWPVAFFFVLTIVATAAVLIANASRSSTDKALTAVPTGVTVGPGSTDIVSKVKRALRDGGYGRMKVGHGGTLDPLASGVLPVALGEATKLAGASGSKGSADPAKAAELLAKIDEIAKIFWETKQA